MKKYTSAFGDEPSPAYMMTIFHPSMENIQLKQAVERCIHPSGDSGVFPTPQSLCVVLSQLVNKMTCKLLSKIPH